MRTAGPLNPRSQRKRQEVDRAARFRGWRTSDEEEIERRRARAASEPMEIVAAEPRHPVFGTFRVGSTGGGTYEVEIRSLDRPDNSCGCADHRVNGLGTCKHIEAVLASLQGSLAGKAGSRRAEVFLRRAGERPQVRVQWPDGSEIPAVKALLARFFSDSGALAGDPVEVLPALARKVAAAPPAVRGRIRLSRQLQPWIEERRRRAARPAAREQFLADVRHGRRTLDPLKLPLYPYQHEGMLHLAFTERALLADEMGLGKTIQAIAACALLRELRGIERVLVVSPVSLKAEWEEQIARFSDLPVRVILGGRAARLPQYRAGAFFYLANYEQILADGDEIQRRLAPDVIVLDEAQRIKNWHSKTAQAVKRLESPYAFVLTGTPLENRIDEIYSIVQFLDPALLGPLFRFNRDFYLLDERGRPAGYQNLDELHRRLTPVLLRRRKAEVEDQLPERTVVHRFVPMDEEQVTRYEEYDQRVASLLAQAKRRPLRPEEFDQLQVWLACMRMICDTPYILDPECRVCPKLAELAEILEEVLDDPTAKVILFSEWERMLELVRDLADEMGLGFAWHTGSVPQDRRRQEIHRFKEDPECRLFLSTEAGGVGLNLQAANVVINLDLPWNPARLEQRIARAWRKHQTRPVHVINLVSADSIEQRMLSLLAGKQALADRVLEGTGDPDEPLPRPADRAAFMARLRALTETVPAEGAEEPRPVASPAPAERLRDELLRRWNDRLLFLDRRAPSGEGGETLLAVLDQPTAGERAEMAALLRQQAGDNPPPNVEILDRATFEAVERLVAAGVLQFTGDGAALHRSPAFASTRGDRRERDRARALETFGHAERKLRMSTVLAAGGFAVEALSPLREAVESALRALAQSR
ncbi:MAG TPA: DEAD/DEAH box helicase, partial [Thermoanaerobaculia bacterium]|nr:DEAD/DEAH box helicase [Thermoanaerobaculia bacterium]